MKIGIDQAKFGTVTNAIQEAGEAITPNLETPDRGDSNVTCLKEFISLYQEVSGLLTDYQALVAKDEEELALMGVKMLLQDQILGRVWEK